MGGPKIRGLVAGQWAGGRLGLGRARAIGLSLAGPKKKPIEFMRAGHRLRGARCVAGAAPKLAPRLGKKNRGKN